MKKTLAILLTLAMLLCVLSACGNSAETPTEAPATEAPAAPDAPPAEEPPAEEPPADEPAGEPQSAIAFPLEESETLTFWHDYDPRMMSYVDSADYADVPINIMAEEATNVVIEHQLTSMDSESEQFNMMVASSSYPDMIKKATNLYTKGAIAALDDDVIIDLVPYLDDYAPNFLAALDLVDGYIKDASTDDGRIPTFISVFAAGQDPSQGLWVRTDLLEKAGLEIPRTYDELTNVMKVLQQNGVEEPLYINPTGVLPNDLLAAGYGVAVDMNFGAGAAATEPFYQVDGKVKFGALEDGWIDYVGMVHGWYADGLISSDFISNTGNAMSPDFQSVVTTGKTAIFVAPTMIIEMLAQFGKDANPDFTIQAIPDITKTPGEKTHFGLYNVTAATEGVSISSSCENAELAAAWCNYWYTEKGQLLAKWGEEGLTYEIVDGEPQWTEFITHNPDGIDKMTMTSLYTMNVGSISYIATDTFGMADWAVDALSTWAEYNDDAWDIPATASFTSEESETYGSIMGEVSTYYNQMILKFITGAEDLSGYEAFKQQLIDMGIETCIEMKQASLDRYLAR